MLSRSGTPPPSPPSPNSQYVNHDMQEAMAWLNETNYWWFYASAQELIDEEDIPKLKKSSILIGRNVLISLGIGLALNVQIKRLPKMNFLTWNRYLRWFCRLPILVAPYFLLFHKNLEKEYSNMFGLHTKYFRRVRGFQRTGDMRYLDPTGKMMQRMM